MFYTNKDYYTSNKTSSDPDQLYFRAENILQELLDYCYARDGDSEEIEKLNTIIDLLHECHENSSIDFIYNNNLDGEDEIYND